MAVYEAKGRIVNVHFDEQSAFARKIGNRAEIDLVELDFFDPVTQGYFRENYQKAAIKVQMRDFIVVIELVDVELQD